MSSRTAAAGKKPPNKQPEPPVPAKPVEPAPDVAAEKVTDDTPGATLSDPEHRVADLQAPSEPQAIVDSDGETIAVVPIDAPAGLPDSDTTVTGGEPDGDEPAPDQPAEPSDPADPAPPQDLDTAEQPAAADQTEPPAEVPARGQAPTEPPADAPSGLGAGAAPLDAPAATPAPPPPPDPLTAAGLLQPGEVGIHQLTLLAAADRPYIYDRATDQPPNPETLFQPANRNGSLVVCTVRLMKRTYQPLAGGRVDKLLIPLGQSIPAGRAQALLAMLAEQTELLAAGAVEQAEPAPAA